MSLSFSVPTVTLGMDAPFLVAAIAPGHDLRSRERRRPRWPQSGMAASGNPERDFLRDRHPLEDNGRVKRVVELVRLQDARRSEHVADLRDAARVRRAVRIGARSRTYAKQEVLRRRREAARLIAREPVLAVESDGERPA